MRIDELDYELPPEAIAARPADPRDQSRLLVYRRRADAVEHRRFCDLPGLLEAGDLLVINETKVLPAKLLLRKETGALIPGLFLAEEGRGRWRIMLRSRGKLAVGAALRPANDADDVMLRLTARGADKGQWIAEVTPAVDARQMLERIGHVPLPPYIEKARGAGREEEAGDRARYQTVYARQAGSVAAPTAGLHFTPGVFDGLANRGIATARVTLHVGLGTFLPVEAATLEEHKMHSEEYVVPTETVAALRRQRAGSGRVVVVGTTSVRTLEATAERILDLARPPAELLGRTDLLIQPGYAFRLTDVLITNFHLPRSTLMALVGALTGLEKLKALYALAFAEGYRFYSYGDAMLVLP